MSNASNSNEKPNSLGKVAQIIGLNRSHLSETLHARLPGHDSWAPLQRIDGVFVPGAHLLAARLARLTPGKVYDVVADPSPAASYALIDCAAYCLAQLVGVEGDRISYLQPKLERPDLIVFLRALGDTLTAALDGLKKPDGYGDDADDAEDEP